MKGDESVSDLPMMTEVLKVTSPKEGDLLSSRSPYEITWQTNKALTSVASIRLFYSKDGGVVWLSITPPLKGDPGRYVWRVPTVAIPKTRCKVKVVLKDANNNILGSDVSDGYFTITP